MRTLVSLALLALALAGCRRPAVDVALPAVPEPTDTTNLPLFDNLDYANWKRFKVGTTVKRKSVTSAEGSPVSTSSVETLTLVELTDREAVVERQNTTERSDGSYKVANPPEKRRFARQFPIPAGMTAEDFSKPARSAKRTGEEAVSVLGKSYNAAVFAWADSTEAGKMSVRVWMSDEMPGRIVKQVMAVPALKSTTTDEVVEVRLP